MYDDIKKVLDISCRLEERVKTVQENQQEINDRFQELSNQFTTITSKVAVIESKNGDKLHTVENLIKELEIRINKLEITNVEKLTKLIIDMDKRVFTLEERNNSILNKFKFYSRLIIDGAWGILVCYVVYKLGIN